MPALFGRQDAKRLDKTYSSPEIVEQRARTRAALGARAGARGLDLGCGPGFLACELARDVAPTGAVVALDASADMLQTARSRAAGEGAAGRIAFVAGDAAGLPFPAASFDFIAAVQVYLYVAEIERALAEAARVLRPGGRLVVVDTDWDSCVWLASDRERHRRMLEARMAGFAQPHLPPRLPGLLGRARLALDRVEVIPIINLRYDPGSFSGDMIGVVRASAIRRGVTPEDAEAWATDLRSRTGDGDYFFCVNRFLFVATKP